MGFLRNNWSLISSTFWLIALVFVLYVVYTYLYPANDSSYTQFLKSDADAKQPVSVLGTVPSIYTGGDFTLSMWVYIDDWNYRVSTSKFLFALSHDPLTSASPLVGILTPLQNSLQIRANVVKPSGSSGSAGSASGSSSSSTDTPDINQESVLQNVLKQQTSMQMFSSTVADAPCDIKEIPLQKWVNITIVSSGRILDVYMDGKLTRSCVLDNVLLVPSGKLKLRLGESGGFGGRYSSVQMWSQQLTPDVIYSIYQMGPSQTQRDIFTDLAKWFGFNVSFLGTASSGPVQTSQCTPSWVAGIENAYTNAGGAMGLAGMGINGTQWLASSVATEIRNF